MKRALLVLVLLSAPAFAQNPDGPLSGLFRTDPYGFWYATTNTPNYYRMTGWDRFEYRDNQGFSDPTYQLTLNMLGQYMPAGDVAAQTSTTTKGSVQDTIAWDSGYGRCHKLTSTVLVTPNGGQPFTRYPPLLPDVCTPQYQPPAGGINVCSPAGGGGSPENQYAAGEACSSPIIIDLGGNGFELTGPNDPVRFDLLANGKPSLWSWTKGGAREGFLVLDRNGNGKIDGGAELFGNHTPLRNGQPAANGYVALAEYDDNHDGAITGADAVFSRLRVWIDTNHDGVSQPGELHTLDSLNLTSISTAFRDSRRRDRFGNLLRYWGRATVIGDHDRVHERVGNIRTIDTCDVYFTRGN